MQQTNQNKNETKTKIDLHMHTNASDGDFELEELVIRAIDAGIKTMAITDHDIAYNAYGPELERIAEKYGRVEILSGIELSCMENGTVVHVLGYFSAEVRNNLQKVEYEIKKTAEAEKIKLEGKVAKLQGAGYNLDFLDVVNNASASGFMNDTHLIRALLAKKQFSEFDEADTAVKGPYNCKYPEGYVPTPKQAVQLIKKYGGVAVLAHPALIEKKLELQAFVEKLSSAGLDGIETYNCRHDTGQIANYSGLCDKYDLIETAGSDYHGTITCPNRRIGTNSKENCSESMDEYDTEKIIHELKQKIRKEFVSNDSYSIKQNKRQLCGVN